jgi:hypothetical protein
METENVNVKEIDFDNTYNFKRVTIFLGLVVLLVVVAIDITPFFGV